MKTLFIRFQKLLLAYTVTNRLFPLSSTRTKTHLRSVISPEREHCDVYYYDNAATWWPNCKVTRSLANLKMVVIFKNRILQEANFLFWSATGVSVYNFTAPKKERWRNDWRLERAIPRLNSRCHETKVRGLNFSSQWVLILMDSSLHVSLELH